MIALWLAWALGTAPTPPVTSSPTAPTAAAACPACAAWNQPEPPFHIHGHTYYVGVQGLSVVLISTSQGLILLDGGLPQSVDHIEYSIEALGFHVRDVRWIVNSHAHFDHAGGIAELQRRSGAQVAAGHEGALTLRSGHLPADDPQVGFGDANTRFPAVANVVELADGASIRLGDVVLVRHAAPGHTPGGSSWSWESEEQGHRVTVVYADSLNAVSAPAFHYLAGSQKNLSDLRQSIRRVHDLPCDILLAPHPDFTGMFEARDHMRAAPTTNAFVQANACRRYAEAAEVRLNARLEQERGEGPATAPWTH